MDERLRLALGAAGLAALLAVELLTPALLLGSGEAAAAEAARFGHAAPHGDPDLLCDLPPGTGVRRYHLRADVITWEFEQGRPVTTWAFNGMIPGPTLCARVGDTLEVTVENRLPTIVSFHTHGLRFPHDQDGTYLSNSYVAPGGTRTYTLAAGADSGGTWAYHDSVAELDEPFVPGVTIPESGEGIERGLYGAVVVVGPDDPPVDHEVLLFLADIGPEVTRSGVLEMVNGRAAPLTPHLTFAEGERVRFRIINAGPNDPHDFFVEGHKLVNAHTNATVDRTPGAGESTSVILGALTFGDWFMTAGAPGEYLYSCAVPGHHEAGMRGAVTIVPEAT